MATRRAPRVHRRCGAGQLARAHYLYILTSGRAEIRTNVDPDGSGPAKALTRVVATLVAPDFFGEMGLITGEPRTADVVAMTHVECYRLHKATFEGVLLERPDIVVETERAKILRGIRTFFGL